MNDPQRWGFMEGDQFIPLPKQPMLIAGLGPPPFTVNLPDGRARHVIAEPIIGAAQQEGILSHG